MAALIWLEQLQSLNLAVISELQAYDFQNLYMDASLKEHCTIISKRKIRDLEKRLLPPYFQSLYAGDVNPRSDTSECSGESCLL